jgi:hypothetical protein
MARSIFQGIHRDGNGRVILSGVCSVYLAGTTTPASVYAAQAGGVAVNSVTCSSTDGTFSFWVDEGDYSISQRFKIVLSHVNYTTATYDYLSIFSFQVNTSTLGTNYLRLTADNGGTVYVYPHYDSGIDGFVWELSSSVPS